MKVLIINGVPFRVINAATKEAGVMISNYQSWLPESTINTIYCKPSKEKRAAFEQIRREKVSVGGYKLRCGSANTYSFSCAYLVWRNKDGVATQYLIYHSRTRCVAIELCSMEAGN